MHSAFLLVNPRKVHLPQGILAYERRLDAQKALDVHKLRCFEGEFYARSRRALADGDFWVVKRVVLRRFKRVAVST